MTLKFFGTAWFKTFFVLRCHIEQQAPLTTQGKKVAKKDPKTFQGLLCKMPFRNSALSVQKNPAYSPDRVRASENFSDIGGLNVMLWTLIWLAKLIGQLYYAELPTPMKA